MPLSSKQKRNGRRARAFQGRKGNRAAASGKDTIYGKSLLSVTHSSGIGTVQINIANICPSRSDISENWQMFRFRGISLKYIPRAQTTAGIGAIGYFGGQASAPTTVQQVATGLPSMCFGVSDNTNQAPWQTTPSSVSVDTRELLSNNPNKWWRTQASASVEAWEENQGTFFSFSPTGAGTIDYECAWVLEVAGPVSSAMIPTSMFSRQAEDHIRAISLDVMRTSNKREEFENAYDMQDPHSLNSVHDRESLSEKFDRILDLLSKKDAERE